MSQRKQYFKRIEWDGQIHIRSGGLQESVTLCGFNDFSSEPDSAKAVTCRECRSIANYCQGHAKLRPIRKAPAVTRADGGAK